MDSTHINMKNSGTRKKKKSVVNGKKRKEPFYLPHWVLYPTWFLCICVILGSAFMVVWYGMNFGNKKSLDWLASVSISLVSFHHHHIAILARISILFTITFFKKQSIFPKFDWLNMDFNSTLHCFSQQELFSLRANGESQRNFSSNV